MLWMTLPIFGFLTVGMHAGYAIYFPELFPRGSGEPAADSASTAAASSPRPC